MESSQIEVSEQPQAVNGQDFIRFQTISDGKRFVLGLDRLYRDLLQEGTDYGKLPGTTKPCMFKAGGEILAKYFGLTTSSRLVQRIVEQDPPYIEFSFSTDVFFMGTKVADGSGSCNSLEPKYAFRYDHGIQREATKNEIFGMQNTIMKMAEKRSYVDAILRATGASRIFTQDLDDMDIPISERAISGNAASGVANSEAVHDGHEAKPISERQKASLKRFLDGNGVHHELASIMMAIKGKEIESLSSLEASDILGALFSFRCSELRPERFVIDNEGFRLENGIIRPPGNTLEGVSLEKRLELAKACWIWNAEKKGFAKREAMS